MLSLYNRNAILLVCILTFTRHASNKRFVLAAGVVRSELDKHGHGNFFGARELCFSCRVQRHCYQGSGGHHQDKGAAA
jgi:hypothetical protein